MHNKQEIHSKSTWLYISLWIIAALLLAATVGMFAQALRYDADCGWSDGKFHSVELEGIYSEEGGEWKEFSRETKFDYRELRDITVRGHFTRDIPQGEKLFLNICQLWVTLRVNGEEAFRFGPEEGDGNPAQSIGNIWFTYVSPGITTEDEVELSFGNLYPNAYFIQFDNLLWYMYTGSERELLSEAVNKDAGMLAMGAIFIVLTLFLFITGILLALLHIKRALQFFWLGLCTMFSAMWFATLAPALSLFIPFPVSLNTLYAFSIQGIAFSVIMFVITNLSGQRKKLMLMALGVFMTILLFAIRLQITGIRDMFSTIDYFSILDSVIALLLIFCLGYEVRVLKNERLITFLKAMIPLVVLGILEMLNGIFQWAEAGICFGLGLFLFALSEGIFIIRYMRENIESEKRALVLEKELAQNRISIMMSQIQPHFLYNSLLGIKQLCDTEPKKASDALEHFSYYLRCNMHSISDSGLILFDKEIGHVEDYLYLEKMRFEERLNIRWEIAYRDFFVPPLTLQPIVENAVRHGITQKEEGGTLTIRSEKTEEGILITIADDGAGFDMTAFPENSRLHVGIQNVRNRIKEQCGGRLEIRSEPGKGTEAKIILHGKENTI